MILTNDGRLHHRLSHPSFDHEKEYDVTVARPIPNGALAALAKGLPMMGTKTRPAEVNRVSVRRFRIVLKEGKNRQIRRMVRKVGHQVIRLKRIRVSNIKLGRLPRGCLASSDRYGNRASFEEALKDSHQFSCKIEAPCSKLQGIFDCKEFYQFFDSLANPAASCGDSARCCSSGFKRSGFVRSFPPVYPTRANKEPWERYPKACRV